MANRLKHPLGGLLFSQFTGAFNDNAWKLLVPFLAIGALEAKLGGTVPEHRSQQLTTLAFVVFTLPLMLFSLPSALLADRLSKRTIILAMKTTEVALMATGAIVLAYDPVGWSLPLVVLALMGVQSALFSPAKYGILPELLPHERLSAGNAAIELWTFLAIIAGYGAGGALLDAARPNTWIAGLVLTITAVFGLVAATFIPKVPPAREKGATANAIRDGWRAIRSERALWLTMWGLTAYWFIASLLGQDILVYCKSDLGLSDTKSSLPLALFGVGVGIGSVLAARLSAGKVEYGLIPLGAVLLGFFTLLLGWIGPGFVGTLVLMAALGVASGLIVVPLHALLQWMSPKDRRGAVIAVSNVFLFGGILCGTLGAGAMGTLRVPARTIMVAAAFATVAGTVWTLYLLPAAFLRMVLIILKNTFYRVRVNGIENVPEEGGALLVPNHVTFIDGAFLITSLDRPVRFIVEASYFHRACLRPFMKALGAIPISATGGPRVILKALRDAGEYLDQGELVCIFAEGQISRTGMLLPFRRGLERIVKGRDCPVIPVHLDRLWGSIFSREGGRFVSKVPRRLPYPVTISYGAPMPTETPVNEVRCAIQELGESVWHLRRRDMFPLHHWLIRSARRGPLHFAFADLTRPRVSRIGALTGAVALARALRRSWQGQDAVGVMLPPSVGGALINIAAAASGRASVNLNYTAGAASVTSAARQAGLKTVVTSKVFLQKAEVELPEGVEPLWLEEIAGEIGAGARIWAFLIACFAPTRLLEKACGAGRRPALDDIATIIFSSGTTGEPKGVPLTHYNIGSNIEGCNQILHVGQRDRMLGILPQFHSFGYLSLWFAASNRMGVVFHPNPLDAAVGELTQRYSATMLVATPTFLQVYMRRCTPAQFGSLRIVIAGAEKLSERLLLAFEETFGVRPIEGYGTTECSPVIAASTLDFRAPGYFQPGARRGYVGQPLPGVAVRVVDLDTGEMVPNGETGMVLVRGPNVMEGYLGREDLTAEVIKDGWYVTGDIGLQDDDGFLKITDRLSRFSKIGGEMVPHGRVEEALQEAAGRSEQVFAVTAVPDEKKGERLAVLHTLAEDALPEILVKVTAGGLPNLFVPRQDQFVRVDKLPLLGTGKLNLREVKRVAEERLGAPREK